MRRRDLIAMIGGAVAAWPLAARAQHAPGPVIGFLSSRSPGESAHLVTAFREGLKDNGYVEDQNVRIEYRWADGHYDRLAGLASDLIGQQVAAIAAVGNTPSTRAAKAVTASIPIVFVVGDDPIKMGLVDNLSRPHGNLTGVTVLFGSLGPKRTELLHELIPGAGTVAMLVNPTNPNTEQAIKDCQGAAHALGLQLVVRSASTESELDAAFAILAQQHTNALLLDDDAFLTARRDQLVALAARYALPVLYTQRDYAVNGGLLSYGGDLRAGYRQVGAYIGRILDGEKPADLPVQQSTKSRAGRESQDRDGAWPYHSAQPPCPRRRGDRMMPEDG
jgi:putative ABC transport system substrate-binding protein